MKNPFKFGKEVSGYQFYYRQEATHSLLRKLRDGSSNIVLFAPRRYGKTSLVLKVLEQLSSRDDIRRLCFDMTRVPTLERFCEEHANAISCQNFSSHFWHEMRLSPISCQIAIAFCATLCDNTQRKVKICF